MKKVPCHGTKQDEIQTRRILKNLVAKLEWYNGVKLKEFKVVVLPDFFVDRVITVESDENFFHDVKRKICAGGGSMRGYNSVDIKGGNAVNVAYCLAKLGMTIDLYTVSDKVGSAILHSVFSSFGRNVNLHIVNGKHGLSSVFEFFSNKVNIDSQSSVSSQPVTQSSVVTKPTNLSTSSNVMVSDVGDNDNFGPELIESKELIDVLENTHTVIFTNWASNFRGTDLLKFVFTKSPNSFHFIDPADFEKRIFEFINVMRSNSRLVDTLSINENEYNYIVKALRTFVDQEDIDLLCVFDTKEFYHKLTNLCTSVKFLSDYFGLKICVHTSRGALLADRDNVTFVSSLSSSTIKIVSGAGDSWDAGFMFGEILGFSTEEKLSFANLIALLHIENSFGDDPTLAEAIRTIKEMSL